MKRYLRIALPVAAVLVLAALIIVPLVWNQPGEQTGQTADSQSDWLIRLPQGPRTYKVAQAAEVWPKLMEARIDPVDTHVGKDQTIEVTVESRHPIEEVYARIKTDNKEFTLPLAYVRDVAADKDWATKFALVSGERGSVIAAAQAEDQVIRAKYRGTWTVDDVHDATYQMVIGAKAGGDESSVTMAWSDACGIPVGGDFTISSPCTISSTDGVDNGNVTLSSSLTLNTSFAFNSGKSFTISGSGSLAVCAGCELKKTNIWQIDADADGFPANSTQYLQDTAPTNGRRRYLLQTATDCNDGAYSATNSCVTSCYRNVDGDAYFSNTATSTCNVAPTSSTQGSDCYDFNANARPGQTNYFNVSRGDGNFDYNCDGSEEQDQGNWTGIQSFGYCRWNPSTGPPGWCEAQYLPTWTGGEPWCGQEGETLDSCKDGDGGWQYPNGYCDTTYINQTEYCI